MTSLKHVIFQTYFITHFTRCSWHQVKWETKMKNSSWGLCSHALKPPKLFPCFSPVVITVFVISHSRETRLLAVRGPCNTLQMSFNYLTVAYKAQCIIQLQKVADGFTIKVNDIPLWPEILCLSVNGVVEQQAANPRRLIYDVVRYMMITIRCARYKAIQYLLLF